MTAVMTAAYTERARFNMIEQQIRPWDVLDPHVLHLLSAIKREDFVPTAFQNLAFADMEIPLPAGQCMLAPKVEARMLQDLKTQASDTVLEIGSGSGFMAALLGRLAQRVVSVEIQPELVNMARHNVRKAGLTNVEILQGDGAQAHTAEGSFDAIMLSGSVSIVPAHLFEKLKIGGRLVAIVGEDPVMHATVIERTSTKDYKTKQTWDTVATRLVNFPQVSRFQF